MQSNFNIRKQNLIVNKADIHNTNKQVGYIQMLWGIKIELSVKNIIMENILELKTIDV